MGDIKTGFGAGGQVVAITLASLANNAARESDVVDNSSDLFPDVLLQVKIKSGGSGTSSSGSVNVYAYGSNDGGTTYGDNATGSDAGITLTSPTNLRLIRVLNVVANGVTYKSNPFSVALAFGGRLPQKWGIVIENKCGGTLDGTGGNHAVTYQGVYDTAS